MTLNEIRQKYINFFVEKGHKEIKPAPLVLENDPTTLFTSSGMQPLVQYLLGKDHESGSKRLVDSQPSIRVQDIEEVGDNRHTTFFEMLGNWSLGDYFKEEQLPWILEFLTDEAKGLGLPKEKIYISIFEGNNLVPKDTVSKKIWLDLGIPEDRIFEYGVKKNWWSRSGTPDEMPEGEIGGPSSELFFEFNSVEHDKAFGETCHPNCDCGRFIEIGNSVFVQYKKENGAIVELPQKNIDFGGGLERIAAAVSNKSDIFEIEMFKDLIKQMEPLVNKKYEDDKPSFRIIIDHIRAATFLANSGVIPSNKLQGYVMRRLIRRAALKARNLKNGIIEPDIFSSLVEKIINYFEIYFNINDTSKLQGIIFDEVKKFSQTLEKGYKEVERIKEIDGKGAFDLYQTYGFPLELSIEIFQEKGQKVNVEEFKKAFAEHQDKSRSASAGTFKGGLADSSEETTKLHTVTHLLHQALRTVLGEHVQQKGSNITKERLRFDFIHSEKLTDDQKLKIEKIVNEQIDKKLPVTKTIQTLPQAKKDGALAFFGEKYEENVSVYTIGEEGNWFSKEVCGGPHVNSLSEINGHVRIIKEEAVSQGVRRIYANIV